MLKKELFIIFYSKKNYLSFFSQNVLFIVLISFEQWIIYLFSQKRELFINYEYFGQLFIYFIYFKKFCIYYIYFLYDYLLYLYNFENRKKLERLIIYLINWCIVSGQKKKWCFILIIIFSKNQQYVDLRSGKILCRREKAV